MTVPESEGERGETQNNNINNNSTSSDSNNNTNNNNNYSIFGMEKPALVRLLVCVITLWLMLLLLTLLVVVGLYTSRANQILVVSCVAVISIALVVASCKLNSIAGISRMVAEDVAAKADPPPTYDDVLHSEAPPPSYFTVVSEAGSTNGSTPSSPAATGARRKEGTSTNPLESQSGKQQLSPPGNKANVSFRRWIGRPGIFQSVKFRASRRVAQSQPVKAGGSNGNKLRRSSSTPSLADLAAKPSMARYPSTPSLADNCGCF